MKPARSRKNINQYASVHTESAVEDASPHKLIQMLISGFFMRINAAKGAMLRKDYQEKSIQISKAVGIIGGLIDGLDLDQGGEIALNLNNLYDYMTTRLFQASAENDPDILDEISLLMKQVQSAWDEIPTLLV